MRALPRSDLAIVQFKVNRDQQSELLVDAGLRNTQIQNHRAIRSGFERGVRFVDGRLKVLRSGGLYRDSG